MTNRISWCSIASRRADSWRRFTQPQELADLVNRLHQALVKRRGKAAAGKILDDPTRHTQFHFAAEEKVLRGSGYPDWAAHRSEHERLA